MAGFSRLLCNHEKQKKEAQMLVNNNPTPWVVLALIILTMCAVFGGMIVWVDPLGPGQPARATQAAINSQATQAALSAIETPQAVFAGQTAIAAQMSGISPAQTATAIALEGNQAVIQAAATGTAIAQDIYIGGLSANATATAIAQNTVTERAKGTAGIAIVVAGTSAICLLIVGHTMVTVLRAHTQEKFAQARFLNEQRRLAEFQVLNEKQRLPRPVIQAPIPNSLMRQPGNGHDLPRAE
jgi:hypothetical protein